MKDELGKEAKLGEKCFQDRLDFIEPKGEKENGFSPPTRTWNLSYIPRQR
jgi:hypothetical protein